MSSKLSCGFCRKAGIFGRKAAHLVKECPLLTKTECRYCHKLGHTKNHCQVLKEKNDRKNAIRKPNFRSRKSFNTMNNWSKKPNTNRLIHNHSVEKVKRPIKSGRFSLLEEDDEPSITYTIALPKPNDTGCVTKGSWVKPMTLKSESEVEEIKKKKAELKVEKVIDTETILAELAIKNQVTGLWGDMMMSEDEEDEEDEEEALDFMGRPMTDNSAW
jgi:hypothetical protein